jgi:hypothetical protein
MMKRRLQLSVVFIWLFLISFNSMAQSHQQECKVNCFSSEILDVQELDDGCLFYTIKVNADASCDHALSHFSVAIPTCAQVSEVSNSEGWKLEYGTDPTTGISGFKVDDINGFGDNGNSGSFLVSFKICEKECEESLSCWAPEVAYKAATCVFYEQMEISCVKLAANLIVTDATCGGTNTGSIEIEILDGMEPYSFIWSNGVSDSINSNLIAGNYSVLITDGTGAELELATQIDEPEPIVTTVSIIDASCSGSFDGAIDATVSGGVAPYTYQWSNGMTEEDITGLKSGYYLLTVTDVNGCQLKTPAIIENTIFISVNGEVTNAGCSTNNGSIDITADGGTEPYSYSWANGSESEDLANLASGTYRVTVTDANGCFSSRTFGVGVNNPLRLTSLVTKTACIENNSGAIDLTISGGLEPYEILWSNNETTEDIQNLAAGTYTVQVSDASGCSSSLNVNITAASFQASSLVGQISCNTAADGNIKLMVSGGTAPYNYDWSTGETTSEVTGLSAGQYSVIITDAAGCSKALSYYIVEPTSISASFSIANPTCLDGDFLIDATISGGVAPYIYTWSDGQSTQDPIDLVAGTYSLQITDAKGCTYTAEVIVSFELAMCNDDDGTGDDGTGDDGTGDDGTGDDGTGDDGTGDDGTGDDGTGDDGTGDDGDIPNEGEDCYNPFSTEITLLEISGSCYTYNAVVTFDGIHVHGLSHLTMDIECGSIDAVTNSENWKIEFGKDPTTGLNGFKIDNVNGFGEGNTVDQFEYTYTICSEDNDCQELLTDADFLIAYKYGQCVSYENVDGEANLSDQITVIAYPNPFTESSQIEFYTPTSTNLLVEVFNRQGVEVKRLYNGQVEGQETIKIKFEADNLPSDIYTYRITTDYGVKYGKLVLTN